MQKRRIACLFIATFLLFSSTVAFADAISDKKKELDGVNENIEKAKSEIGKVKTEQDGLVDQIADIELDLKTKEEQLTEIEQSLEALQESIEITEKELEEAIERANVHKELMDERLCAMYMNSDTSYLEVVFEAKNITDFVDRLVMVKEIMTMDREMLDEMQAIKKNIEEQKEYLEEQREIEEGTKRDVAAQKAAIEEKQEEKEALLAQLKEQREKMEKDLGKLEKTSEELETAIKTLVAQREQEREERIRAQAEAAAAAQTNSTPSRGTPRDSSQVGGTTNKKDENVPTNVSGGSSALAQFALSHRGKPYKWGSTGPNSFDCSGFVCYVYSNFGIDLSSRYRTSSAQATMPIGTKITNRSALRSGDLVFFGNGGISHVGIYIGGGSFVHAANSKTGVIVSSLNSGSYSRRFKWGRRVIN